MANSIEELEAAVMNLGTDDRNRILERLLASVEERSEIEADWLAEAQRRKAAVAAGESHLISGDAAIARLEASLL